MYFGVFSHDCYGLTDDESQRFLLKTFDNFNDALKYAVSVGESTAIHFTSLRVLEAQA